MKEVGMEKILLLIIGVTVVGVLLSFFKLYVGYGLVIAGCASYLSFYYSLELFVEAVNKDNLAAGRETYDFVGQYAFTAYAAWIFLAIYLVVLLFQGSSKD